jgi:F0F1-type ATP synthase assembly protein I
LEKTLKDKRTARIVIGSLLTVAVCAAVAFNVDWNAFLAAAGGLIPFSLLPAMLFLAAGKIVYTAK